MNKLDFTFEQTPWEATLSGLRQGDRLSAVHFLAVMEGETEEALEDAFRSMEDLSVALDVSDLPKVGGTGEAAARLRQEEQLAAKGDLLTDLPKHDPLRLYLEDLAMIPACGDVRVLAVDAAAGSEDAKAMLVNLSLSRVVEIAKEYVGRGVLLLDLIQEGSLGLWQAILNHQNGDFEAQRDWWIRQFMTKEVVLQARSSGVGQKMRQAAEDYRMVDERLLGELGRNPTMEEIAEVLHMSVEETLAVRNLLENARVIQKAHEVRESEAETEEDDQAVEDTAYFQSRQRIHEMLSGLSPEEAELISLRFGLEGGLPLSPEDTGRKLGLTPDEVVAREAAALAKLRQG